MQEDFTRTESIKSKKSRKSRKSTKKTNRKQGTFLLLDVFLRIKSMKSIKSAKSAKRKQAIFCLLDVFMRIKMMSFLFLYACMRFVLFVCVKSSRKRIIKRFKIALIPSFTMLLTCTPLNLPMASYLYSVIFIYDHLWESFF